MSLYRQRKESSHTRFYSREISSASSAEVVLIGLIVIVIEVFDLSVLFCLFCKIVAYKSTKRNLVHK